MKSIHNLASYDRGSDNLKNYIKHCEFNPDVYELRPGRGQIRLFFFYHPTSHDIVVCTNIFWKAEDDREVQDRAFTKCHNMRKAYLMWLEQTKTPGKE